MATWPNRPCNGSRPTRTWTGTSAPSRNAREYEPHIDQGFVIYAGVDYEAILREAEKEADVILWDGGNNDCRSTAPTCTSSRPTRCARATRRPYHPGEANVRMADVVVINKCDSARPEDIAAVEASVAALNPKARIVLADSPVTVDDVAAVAGKRVVVIEDGPTLTTGRCPSVPESSVPAPPG